MFPIRVQQGSSQHRLTKLVGFGLLAFVLFVIPFVLPEWLVGRTNRAILMAVAVLGLNLVVGYAGLLALCQSAFIAIGAFITASLVADEGMSYYFTIPFAMIGAFVCGLLLGIPALRIKGLYLAMATVAFAAAFPGLAKLELWGIAERTGGVNGKNVQPKFMPPQWAQDLGFSTEDPARFRYFPILFLAVLAFLGVANLLKSRPGRAIVAIRDNETGAAVSGVNLRRTKVLNFGISAALGGLAGSMWAMNTGFVAEQDYTFVLMVDLLVALVVGGVASLSGPIYGALVVVFVKEFVKGLQIPLGFYTIDGAGPLAQAIFGSILIIVVFFAPRGIAGFVTKIKNKLFQVTPTPPALPDGAESISDSDSATAVVAEASR